VEVNIDNAVAACSAVLLTGETTVTDDVIRQALATFQGAKRRFEFWLRSERCTVIDDYAHHPDELKASIASVRRLFPEKRLTVAFQPHLFTRTRDFAPQFAAALSQADSVMILPIYPAREEPIEGVDAQLILSQVTAKEASVVSKEELVERVAAMRPELLLTVGAGDINLLLPQIVDCLK
jgi:UDP-N-acetylmuramate--alanine ligase